MWVSKVCDLGFYIKLPTIKYKNLIIIFLKDKTFLKSF